MNADVESVGNLVALHNLNSEGNKQNLSRKETNPADITAANIETLHSGSI